MTTSELLARRFLHVNLNCVSLDRTEALYSGVLGLRTRMRTDPDIATDGSILGIASESYCSTSFLYDARGGRGGCALEVIEYRDPPLALDPNPDPKRPGIRSALIMVPDLERTAGALRRAGFAVGDETEGLIAGRPAVLVSDADGVVVEVAEGSDAGGLFDGIRISTADAQATSKFLRDIGFTEDQPPEPVSVSGSQIHPGGSADTTKCLVARYTLVEDADRFSVVVVSDPATPDTPVPWGGNRQGLYRCALRVENLEEALAAVPASVEVMGDPVWCPLPGTKIDGLYIAFLRSPDGVVFEFVERPLSFFTR